MVDIGFMIWFVKSVVCFLLVSCCCCIGSGGVGGVEGLFGRLLVLDVWRLVVGFCDCDCLVVDVVGFFCFIGGILGGVVGVGRLIRVFWCCFCWLLVILSRIWL